MIDSMVPALLLALERVSTTTGLVYFSCRRCRRTGAWSLWQSLWPDVVVECCELGGGDATA